MLLFVREQCRKMQRQEEKGQVAMLTHPEIGQNSHQQDCAVEGKVVLLLHLFSFIL